MTNNPDDTALTDLPAIPGQLVDGALERLRPEPTVREVGIVTSVGTGVANVRGLPGAMSDEVVRFEDGSLGMVFNLEGDRRGIVLLDSSARIESGQRVFRTGRVIDVPVGEELIGRVVDPLGRPRDGYGAPRTERRRPVERPAPSVMDRARVADPLQTGIKVVDSLIPIGRGQRELIVGDRQTGKTAIAVDAMLNQRDTGVVCIYCAVGQRASGSARVIDDLREHEAMDYSVAIVTTGEDAAGLQFIAPYAATSVAEEFMHSGRDVLLVFDDMTHHARAYRQVSLLLRRPPGREAYPGDIFYIHSRLLERATHLSDEHGGGSITALPIVETQAQNISAYIPTNLISITDGQIYLSPDLFQKGVLPAVDVGRSVSRVGGKAQLPAYREVAGDLKLTYSQFEELERFSRYGTRMEESVRRQLERGRRVRAVLKQNQFENIPVPEQIAVLFAAKEGLFDEVSTKKTHPAARRVRAAMIEKLPELCERILGGEKIDDDDRTTMRETFKEAIGSKEPDGSSGKES